MGTFTGTISDGELAIATTAGLQAALDAKAADADVVHDSGNETIAGTKTFSSAPAVPDASFAIAKTATLVDRLKGTPLVCKFINGTGWRTLAGGAIPTDGLQPLYYDSTEHDPVSVTVTAPTSYSAYDKWFPYYEVV